jgi:aminopeptidase
VVVVGLGEQEKCTAETIRCACAVAAKLLRDKNSSSVAIEALHGDGQSTAEGVILGLYQFNELKTQTSKKEIKMVHFVGTPEQIKDWETGVIIARSQNITRRMAELPANISTPTFFVNEAQRLFKDVPKTTVISHDVKWAEEKKMGAFLSVTHGAVEPAKFLEIHYKGADEQQRPFVFVGKGITFDSGGPSSQIPMQLGELKLVVYFL